MSDDAFHFTRSTLDRPGAPAAERWRADAAPLVPTARPTGVSVVICAYTEERWDFLLAAVDSVFRQTLRCDECIVVIDHHPRLFERARLALPTCTVVESAGLPGVSAARNTGIELCRSEIVAFLDDDAVAEPDWLELLLAGYRDPSVVAVGGRVAPKWLEGRPSWFPEEFDWVVGCSHSGMPKAPSPVRNLIGANMSVRKDLIGQTGGFLSSLGRLKADTAGCEETELCIRAAMSSEQAVVLYEPSARVYQHVPPKRGTPRYFLRRCWGEGRSKAVLADAVGTERGLSDERSYVARTVPLGVLRAAGEVARGRPRAGLRALACIAGVAVTTLGYVSIKAPSRKTIVRHLVGLAGPLAAFALFLLTLETRVPLDKMTDFGLLSVLPPCYWVGLVVLCLSFCVAVRRRKLDRLALAAHIVVLLLLFHLTPAVVYGTLRYSWAWKHTAITDYLVANHGVNLSLIRPSPIYVAYQDWPGFFSLNGLLTSASGFSSPLSYASWGPFVDELLFALPLWLIFRELTTDPRVRWTALWLFYLGNWIGQDYFSPQALCYFLYLVVVGVVFSRFLRSVPASSRRHRSGSVLVSSVPPAPLPRGEVVGGFLLVALCAAAISVSHQLTPFMLMLALVALLVFRRLRYRSLAVIPIVAGFGWIAIGARTFVSENLPMLYASIGQLFSNATVNEYNAGQASPDQLAIADIDRAFTAAVVLLALAGALRCWRQGRLRFLLPAVLLTIAPGAAFAASNYGGEIVFRVYLFALPFLAFFGATLFGSRAARAAATSRLTRWAGPALVLVSFGFLGGFLFSYFGKERSNYFPPAEVSAVEAFYRSAPSDSLVITADGNIPWPLERYDRFVNYVFVAGSRASVRQIVRHPVATLSADLAGSRHPAYLVFASSDASLVEMTGALPKGSYGRIEHAVLASNRFRVLVHNRYVAIVTSPANVATTSAVSLPVSASSPASPSTGSSTAGSLTAGSLTTGSPAAGSRRGPLSVAAATENTLAGGGSFASTVEVTSLAASTAATRLATTFRRDRRRLSIVKSYPIARREIADGRTVYYQANGGFAPYRPGKSGLQSGTPLFDRR